MRVLLLSTFDRAGGAEKVAFDLYRSYRKYGHDARLLVKYKRAQEEGVLETQPYMGTPLLPSIFARLECWVRGYPKFRGQYRLVDALRRISYPRRWLDHWRGIEDFNYPYSHRLLDDPGWSPNVIHTHNLHGDYFDLRALSGLSRRVPTIWTLHDAWAFTGHCGQFIDCERWHIGCGDCPDLKRPPAIRRDGTAENWRRKREVYADSRLAIATPSRWLMNRVEQSMLQPWRTRVVPNGVDTSVFKPGIREQARDGLGLPQNAFICLFVAYKGSNADPYKDFETVDRAMRIAVEKMPSLDWQFVCLGGDRKTTHDPHFRHVGYVDEPRRVTMYYQASDVFLHAANAEALGLVIIEAQACGTPVIATSVGGIPEAVTDGETGFLVPRGDSYAMAQRIVDLANQPSRRWQMGQSAALHVQSAFSLDQQTIAYLDWFDELVAMYRTEAR